MSLFSKRLILRPSLLVLALVCIRSTALGQVDATIPIDTSDYTYADDYLVYQIDGRDGLIQNTISKVEVDKHGILWLAHESGISGFDGVNMINFSGDSRSTSYAFPYYYWLYCRIPSFKDGRWVLDLPVYYKPNYVLFNQRGLALKGRPPLCAMPMRYVPDFLKQKGKEFPPIGLSVPDGSGRFYFLVEDSIFWGKDDEWIAERAPFNPGGNPQGLSFVPTASLFISSANKPDIIHEYYQGTRKATYHLPFIPQKKYSKYFYHNGNVYELINDTPGHPILKLILKDWSEPLKFRSVYQHPETGDIYFGTERNGLFILRKKILRPISNAKSSSTVIDSSPPLKQAIYFIYQDREGGKWWTSNNGGLWFGEEGKLTKLPLDRQKLSKQVHSMAEDISGFYWVSTVSGLLKFSAAESQIFVEGKSNSLYYHTYPFSSSLSKMDTPQQEKPQLELNNKGNLLLHYSSKSFEVDQIVATQSNRTYPSLIHNFKLNGQDSLFKGPFVLDREFSKIEFKFSMPYLGETNNLYIDYSLGRSKDHWLPIKPTNVLRFQSLEPGSYVLKIRSRSGFNENNLSITEFRIKVIPYWYETIWFRAVLASLFLIGLAILFIYRLHYSKRKKLKLEESVRLRKKELNALNNQLQLNNSFLGKAKREQEQSMEEREQMANLYRNSVREPLQKIIRKLKLLSNEKDDLASKKSMIAEISNVSSQIFSKTENFFDWIKVLDQKIDPVKLELDVYFVIEEILEAHQDSIKEKMLSIVNSVQEEAQIISEPNAFSIVLDILINNAIRYNYVGGEIVFEYEQGEDYQMLKIKNTGSEINEFMLTLNPESEQAHAIEAARGLMDKLDGYIEFNSSKSKGIEVYLFFKDLKG